MKHLSILYCFFFLLTGCKEQKKDGPQNKPAVIVQKDTRSADTSLAGDFSSQSSVKFEPVQLDRFFIRYPSARRFKKDITEFYARRHYAFAWYDANGQIEQAGYLYNRVRNLPDEGIFDEVPYIHSLDSLMENTGVKDSVILLREEMLLTSMYFYFAEKAWSGLGSEQTQKMGWFLPRKQVDYIAWLKSFLQSPAAANDIREPVYRQYGLLKAFLQKYKDIDQQRWKPIHMNRKSYRLGDTAEELGDIKKRLYALGDLRVSAGDHLFDPDLAGAVQHFQRRFGLRDDGIIGGQMIRAFNEPIEKRIRQICVNMERSRWVPDSVRDNYVVINIPEFKLHMYNSDSLLWDMNVVVGQSVHKTVIFSGLLKYIVFSPYWNVPPGILKNEILPGIKKNKHYLATHHMEWNGGGVRQLPGPWNSLGRVKFLFPNSFSIYMHDTPAKSLFGEDKRAFSHGCIRLAEPAKLALYLLRNDPAWNADKVNGAMNSGKEKYVTIKESFPVFITYFTAWVDRTGNLNFRDDVYGRDRRLEQMLVVKK